MARVEAIYELRDRMSSRLDDIERKAARLEQRLKSLDKEVDKKNAAFSKWEQTSRRLGQDRGVENFLKRNTAALKAYNDQLERNKRVGGPLTGARPPMMGGAGPGPLGGIPTNIPDFTSPRTVGRAVARGGGGGFMLPAVLLGGPVVAQGLGALGGALGGGLAAGGLAYGAAGTAAVAGMGMKAAVGFGAKPLQEQLARAQQQREQLQAITQQRRAGTITGTQAREQRQRVRATGADIPQNATEAARNLDKLNTAYEKTFTTGRRAAQQYGLLNDSLKFAAETGLPMATRAWDEFFPVFDKSLRRVEEFIGSPQGQREWERFVHSLAPVSGDLVKLGVSGARFGAGMTAALAPFTRWGLGKLTDFFGDAADWAASQKGMDDIRRMSQAAKPVLEGVGDVTMAIGRGFRDLLTGAGGRAAAYLLEHLAQDTIPAFVRYMNRAAEETPRFVDILDRLASIATTLFGPGSAFYMGITLLNNFATAAEGVVRALGPLAGPVQAGLGTAGALALARKAGPVGGAVAGGGILASVMGPAGLVAGAGMGAAAFGRGAKGGGPGSLVGGSKAGGSFLGRMVSGMNPFASGLSATGRLGAVAKLGGRAFWPAAIGITAYQAYQASRGGGPGGGADRMATGFAPYDSASLIGGRTMAPAQTITRPTAAGEMVSTRAPGGGLVRTRSTVGGTQDIRVPAHQVAGQRYPEEEKRIREETRLRASAVRELYTEYQKVSKEIDKQKGKETDVTALVEQRRTTLEQIAAESPQAVTYGRFGAPKGVRPQAVERVAAGLEAGVRPNRRSVSQRFNQLERGRRRAGRAQHRLLQYARGISPMRGAELEQALATGDTGAILAIQRQLEQAEPAQAGQTTAAFQSYQKTTAKTGTFQEVMQHLQDLEPVFRKHVGTLKDYRQEMRRVRREASANFGASDAAQPDSPRERRRQRRAPRDPQKYLDYVKNLGRNRTANVDERTTPGAQSPKQAGRDTIVEQAKGIRAGKREAIKATEEVQDAVEEEISSATHTRLSRRVGARIARYFAEGLSSEKTRVRKDAHELMRQALRGEMDQPAHYALSRRIGKKVATEMAAGIREGIPAIKSAAAAATAASTPTSPGGTPTGGDPGSWSGGNTLSFARQIAEKFGLRISSTYRDPKHNAEVGGVINSQHTHGDMGNPGAVDAVGSGTKMASAAEYARNHGVPRVLVHDAGSGMHLHMGFFDEGGRTGRKSPRQIAGMVHHGEFVVTPHGEAMLEKMTGRRGVLDQVASKQKPNWAGGVRTFAQGGRAATSPTAMTVGGGAPSVQVTIGSVEIGSHEVYERFVTNLARDLQLELANLTD